MKKIKLPEGKEITVYMKARSLNEYGDGPRYAWFCLDQVWVDRVKTLARLVKKHDLAYIKVWQSPCWRNADEYRISGETLAISNNCFWYSGYPKNSPQGVETNTVYFDSLAEAVADAVDQGMNEVFIAMDESDIACLRESIRTDDKNQECAA